MPLFSKLFVSVLGCWFVSSSLYIYPHSLSYFNESIGGPLNGPKYLLGSNVDWGQDLRYFKWWRELHPEVATIHLAWFGGYDPRDVGVEYNVTDGEVLKILSSRQLPPGWYAISASFLAEDASISFGSLVGSKCSDNSAISCLREMEPADMASQSMYIYRIEPD